MIMTIEELRKLTDSEETDEMITIRLEAAENFIRGYTHNNFQNRFIRTFAEILGGALYLNEPLPLSAGDTVQISESKFNSGLYVVDTVNGVTINLKNGDVLREEFRALVTKVLYPADIKIGVANLIKWEAENRNKTGIQSETISRHSVTYADANGDSAVMGYPKAALGFLQPYMKARF